MRRPLLAQAESWTALATGKKDEERCMCQFRHSRRGRHIESALSAASFQNRSAQPEKRGCARSARLTRLNMSFDAKLGSTGNGAVVQRREKKIFRRL
jgi:hypothetical protein